ncbi:MAG: dephospho-CoA kinase [Betaproteobacteria bacterium]|nr:dephospho-CoA kinase [Betaproteobacteria bacterium]
MYLVGLTGGIGSGKSAVAELFAARAIAVIDADAIAHQLTAPGGAAISAIRDSFGADFIDASGALARDRMRARAFTDPQARARLEAILHPLIRAESSAQIDAATSPYVVHMVPLLVEFGLARSGRYQRVLVVDCPAELQVERVMRRSKLAESEVLRIMATQASREARLACADDVIDNGGPQSALTPQVDALHRSYLQFASIAPPQA